MTTSQVAEASLALLLIGAPGAGKSTTLTRVHDDLEAKGIQSAAIDTDELARSYPPIGLDRHLEHARALATSYLDVGHRLVLVAATVESNEGLGHWLNALDVDRHVVVHLVAGAEALEARVSERESPDWAGLAELLQSARRLAPLRFDRTDAELDTTASAPAEIADAVLAEVQLRLHDAL